MARFTSGWIKLHRSILEKDLVENINLFSLWNYLLLIAVYKETQIIWKGKQRILDPGTCVLGINDVAKMWDLSSRTISKWLHYLNDTGRIVLESCAHGTVVTICNWKEYQEDLKEGFAPSAHQVHTNCAPTAHQVLLSKEDKKERKKEKNTNVGIRMDYPQEFDDLWKRYERKGDKKKSFEEWKKLKLSLEENELLIVAIKNYLLKNPDAQFRKDFERFIKTDWREHLHLNGHARELTLQEKIERGIVYIDSNGNIVS